MYILFAVFRVAILFSRYAWCHLDAAFFCNNSAGTQHERTHMHSHMNLHRASTLAVPLHRAGIASGTCTDILVVVGNLVPIGCQQHSLVSSVAIVGKPATEIAHFA